MSLLVLTHLAITDFELVHFPALFLCQFLLCTQSGADATNGRIRRRRTVVVGFGVWR
jgi:hypothetical protein